MEAILFPDAASVVIDALLDVLPGDGYDAGVYGEIPNPRPSEFVVVERLGGPRAHFVQDQAQLAVDCWSTDDQAAHDFAQVVRARIHEMQGRDYNGGAVGRIDELSGPFRNPDPDSAQDRYSFQLYVPVRGQALDAGS
jgi:hypothetical protein